MGQSPWVCHVQFVSSWPTGKMFRAKDLEQKGIHILLLTLRLISCGTFGKVFNLLQIQFPLLSNEDIEIRNYGRYCCKKLILDSCSSTANVGYNNIKISKYELLSLYYRENHDNIYRTLPTMLFRESNELTCLKSLSWANVRITMPLSLSPLLCPV